MSKLYYVFIMYIEESYYKPVKYDFKKLNSDDVKFMLVCEEFNDKYYKINDIIIGDVSKIKKNYLIELTCGWGETYKIYDNDEKFVSFGFETTYVENKEDIEVIFDNDINRIVDNLYNRLVEYKSLKINPYTDLFNSIEKFYKDNNF
jgi:hypothetical protein